MHFLSNGRERELLELQRRRSLEKSEKRDGNAPKKPREKGSRLKLRSDLRKGVERTSALILKLGGNGRSG